MAQRQSGKRRRYSAEEREEILRSARQQGVAKAGREHGVPQSTISNWRKKLKGTSSPPSEAELPTSETEQPMSVEQDGTAVDAAADRAEKSKQPARRYTPSQKAAALEYAAKHGVSAAHRKLDISRYSRIWLPSYAGAG